MSVELELPDRLHVRTESDIAEYLELGEHTGDAVISYDAAIDQRSDVCRVDVPVQLARRWNVLLVAPPGQYVGPGGVSEPARAEPLGAYCELTFGVGTALSVAEIDWSVGQSFSVSGSSVAVRVIVPARGALPGLTDYPARFRAAIVPAGCGCGQVFGARRSIEYGTIALAPATTRAIPPFANRVWIQARDPNGLTPAPTFYATWQGIASGVAPTAKVEATGAPIEVATFAYPLLVPSVANVLTLNMQQFGDTLENVIAVYELGL